MARLLAGVSFIALACSVAYAAPPSEQGAPASTGAAGFEASLVFHASTPAFTLGHSFAGALVDDSTVLSVTPVSLLLSPELFAPGLTGSQQAPAAPIMWTGDSDNSLASRFIVTMNRLAGPQDELRPSNLGIRAALNGTDPAPMTAEWVPVRNELNQRLTDYAFDFGAEDLTGAVADNEQVLALFGWNGEIDAPVVAQGE